MPFNSSDDEVIFLDEAEKNRSSYAIESNLVQGEYIEQSGGKVRQWIDRIKQVFSTTNSADQTSESQEAQALFLEFNEEYPNTYKNAKILFNKAFAWRAHGSLKHPDVYKKDLKEAKCNNAALQRAMLAATYGTLSINNEKPDSHYSTAEYFLAGGGGLFNLSDLDVEQREAFLKMILGDATWSNSVSSHTITSWNDSKGNTHLREGKSLIWGNLKSLWAYMWSPKGQSLNIRVNLAVGGYGQAYTKDKNGKKDYFTVKANGEHGSLLISFDKDLKMIRFGAEPSAPNKIHRPTGAKHSWLGKAGKLSPWGLLKFNHMEKQYCPTGAELPTPQNEDGEIYKYNAFNVTINSEQIEEFVEGLHNNSDMMQRINSAHKNSAHKNSADGDDAWVKERRKMNMLAHQKKEEKIARYSGLFTSMIAKIFGTRSRALKMYERTTSKSENYKADNYLIEASKSEIEASESENVGYKADNYLKGGTGDWDDDDDLIRDGDSEDKSSRDRSSSNSYLLYHYGKGASYSQSQDFDANEQADLTEKIEKNENDEKSDVKQDLDLHL